MSFYSKQYIYIYACAALQVIPHYKNSNNLGKRSRVHLDSNQSFPPNRNFSTSEFPLPILHMIKTGNKGGTKSLYQDAQILCPESRSCTGAFPFSLCTFLAERASDLVSSGVTADERILLHCPGVLLSADNLVDNCDYVCWCLLRGGRDAAQTIRKQMVAVLGM